MRKHDYAMEPFEKMLVDNPEVPVAITLTITLHASGALSVSGPVQDKKLCMVLLDNARDALKRQADLGIVVPAYDTGIKL